MPKISPKARRALTEERRKQILDAASQVFAQKGFDRATIADIAQAAGVAEGSIYNYFKNKGDLLVSIPRQAIQPTIESLGAHIANLTSESPAPEQMLATFAHQMIATIQQNVHVFRILLSALPTMSQSTREKYLNQVVMYGVGTLETYFREQIKRGAIRRGLNPTLLARGFTGMLIVNVALREVLQIETDATWDYDQLVAEVIAVFLYGVRADPAKRKSK